MKNQEKIQVSTNKESTESFILPNKKDLSDYDKESDKYSSKLTKKKIGKNNSLDYLTKKFAKYVYNSDLDIININNAIKVLKINKRRIYDITNVFEGKK